MSKALVLAVAVGGVGALVYSQLPELRRYMKIKGM
jgi:hypothetical protein